MNADQDRCMALIEPLLGALHDCLLDGMAFRQDPSNYSAEAIAQQRGRTASNCVNDHAFHRLRERLDGRSGCHFLNIRQLELLNFRDEAIIRLKRVNGAGRASNLQTPQQQDYDDQKVLPGLPEGAVRLVAGYQADVMFTAVDRVIISRPLGRDVRWAAQVTMFDQVASWEDITPTRLEGFDREDFNPARRRKKR